jgi:hypothetical protein
VIYEQNVDPPWDLSSFCSYLNQFLFFEKGGLLGRLPPFSLLNIVIFFLEKDKITKKFTRKKTDFKGKIS